MKIYNSIDFCANGDFNDTNEAAPASYTQGRVKNDWHCQEAETGGVLTKRGFFYLTKCSQAKSDNGPMKVMDFCPKRFPFSERFPKICQF